MKIKYCQTKKTAQEIQDKIFKNMSADRKIEIGSQLWRLAKDVVGDKISFTPKKFKKY